MRLPKILLLVFIILQIAAKNYSQVQILKGFDFDSDDYAMLITAHHLDTISGIEIIDSVYYIDKSSDLNQIKKDWVLTRKNMLESFTDYKVYITKNDSVVLKMWLSVKGKELFVENGIGQRYQIGADKISRTFKMAKKATSKSYDFGNDTMKGRTTWRTSSKNENIVLRNFLKPKWINFEGEFTIFYSENKGRNANLIRDEIANKIGQNYPKEQFVIETGAILAPIVQNHEEKSNKMIHYSFIVYCNKSMFAKFKIYEAKFWKEFDSFKFKLFYKD